MEEEKKTPEREEEQALPVQELPTDIPAEVRQKLAEDLNEQATEDLKQDVREAEKEEANDEEVKANPEMLTKSRQTSRPERFQTIFCCCPESFAENPGDDLF